MEKENYRQNKPAAYGNSVFAGLSAALVLLFLTLDSCAPGHAGSGMSAGEQEQYQKIRNEIELWYGKHNDTLKLNVAMFLLSNSRFHLHEEGEKIDAYKRVIDRLPQMARIQEDSLRALGRKYGLVKDSLYTDLFMLDSKRLISHVDDIVDHYRKTLWQDKIPFRVFCDYLVSYKTSRHEAISLWGKFFRDAYFAENDSTILGKEAKEVVEMLHEWIYRRTMDSGFKSVWGREALYLPALSPIIIDSLRVGSCDQLVARSSAVMRAMGIPATADFTPQYLDINSEHSWNVAIINDSTQIPFDATSEKLYEYKADYYKTAKVYRQAFAPQKDAHVAIRGLCDFLPAWLNNPFNSDVTIQYVKTSDLSVQVKKTHSSNAKYAYLSVFNPVGWFPVAWGQIKRGKANFKDVGTGGVYLPLIIEENGLQFIDYPLILSDSGNVHYLKPEAGNKQSLILLRKFPVNIMKTTYLERMTGGVFQGANTPDFSDAWVLHVVDYNPGEHFNTVVIEKSEAFRYIRYVGPAASHCNIVEMEIYGSSSFERALQGTVIGTQGSWKNNPATTREAAFDGNPLTYVDSYLADGAWIGLDLGGKVNVGKIRFLARNDLNSNRYETEGVEERIFTYENGKQVWW